MELKRPARAPRASTLWSRYRLKLAGLGLIFTVGAVAALALASFAGVFHSTVPVTVDAPRSGLVLDPDAKVRSRGVEVGRVSAVDYRGDRAQLTLAIDPDQLRLISSDAQVDIRSSTVFGAKYVNLVIPPNASPLPMKAGTTIRADEVTVEINTVFQKLAVILDEVEPSKLNSTLNAIGTALSGRGDTLGDTLTRTDAYLKDINPSLPALRRDSVATQQVTAMYADTADDLLRIIANVTESGATVAQSGQQMDALLISLTGLGNTTRSVLTENERNLVSTMALLRPTVALLQEYAPALSCVINGIGSLMPLAEELFGGGPNPWLSFNANFMLAGEAYRYPNDLPKVNATGGPRCNGVLDRVPGSHSDYIVTDTNQGSPYIPPTHMATDSPRVFEVLFGGLPGVTSGF